jgi:hypothetical protein
LSGYDVDLIISLLNTKLNIHVIADELFMMIKNRNKGFLKKLVYLADNTNFLVKREIFELFIVNELYEQLAVIISIGKKEQNKTLIKSILRHDYGEKILFLIIEPAIKNCAINSEIDREKGVIKLMNIWQSFRELNIPDVFDIVKNAFINIINNPGVFERVRQIVSEAYLRLTARG